MPSLAPSQAFSFQFSVVWSPVYALLQPLQEGDWKCKLETTTYKGQLNLSNISHQFANQITRKNNIDSVKHKSTEVIFWLIWTKTHAYKYVIFHCIITVLNYWNTFISFLTYMQEWTVDHIVMILYCRTIYKWKKGIKLRKRCNIFFMCFILLFKGGLWFKDEKHYSQLH